MYVTETNEITSNTINRTYWKPVFEPNEIIVFTSSSKRVFGDH